MGEVIMGRSFKLPDLGEGIHEGEILAVPVSVGDMVKEGDTILEVETDKAAVEIPSPYTGRIEEILCKPGDIVKVGEVLMVFSDLEPAVVEMEPEKLKAAERPAKPEAVAPPAAPIQPVPSHERGPIPASPATRRLARELGVDLNQVPPSGPGGLVTAEDVRAFAGKIKEEAKPAPVPPPEARPAPLAVAAVPPLPDFSKWGPIERVPVRSIRRATAKQMALSWSQIPHVNSQATVDITKLEAFRRQHKARVEAKGGRLTITVFALKAVVAALKAYPRFNASLDTQSGEIILKHYYHIGVAVNTDDGLIVPVIRDVDHKSIIELSIELNDLVQRTRNRKVTLEEMKGGVFTITNVGPMGGSFFAPIINYPEVAILGLGGARLQPVVRGTEEDYEIVPRLLMPLILTIDHRVLDGADAMLFMRVITDALEDPEELLMNI
jgi:pyruvate dehydrogenase E2 component (dihydrolipoamide acetyltransferase)